MSEITQEKEIEVSKTQNGDEKESDQLSTDTNSQNNKKAKKKKPKKQSSKFLLKFNTSTNYIHIPVYLNVDNMTAMNMYVSNT